MEDLLQAKAEAEKKEAELPTGEHMVINGELKLNPYNFNNKFITKNEVEHILKRYGIFQNIGDLAIYQKAFVHESYSIQKVEEIMDKDEISLIKKPEGAIELQPESSERLEFLGDSIVGASIAHYLYERFPNEDEGFLSKMRTNLVNKYALAHLAKTLKFEEFLILSRHTEDMCNGRTNVSNLEDCFEAFVGAIFLDFNTRSISMGTNFLAGPGFQIAQEFVINLIEHEDAEIDFTDLILNDTNYKDKIIKYYRRVYKKPPTYNKLGVGGTVSKKIFTVNIEDPNGVVIGTARGKTVKAAQQKASKRGLIKMGLLDMEDSDSDVE